MIRSRLRRGGALLKKCSGQGHNRLVRNPLTPVASAPPVVARLQLVPLLRRLPRPQGMDDAPRIPAPMEPRSRILLISPPMDIDSPPRFIAFGILYVAMALRKAGHQVELLDIEGHRYSKEQVIDLIREKKPDVIGIGGLVTIYAYLLWIVPEIRKILPDVPIIVGGTIASSLKERLFQKTDVDFLVIGEGEVTAVELLREMETTRNFDGVRGIGFRRDGQAVFTPSRPLMDSLDDVPILDYSDIQMDKLLASSNGVAQIPTQRGCPFNCTFCYNNFRVISSQVRYRPVGHVLDEIQLLQNKYKINLFAITGECITADRQWVFDFCQEILRRGLKINYRITSRVDTIDEEMLQWLQKSGCGVISFGLESGSKKILGIMKKGISPEKAIQTLKLARKYIPELQPSIILGYIGETKETLADTLQYCKDINVRPEMFYATPYPGTALFRMAMDKGRIPDEEAFLLSLNRSTIMKPQDFNLTDMPDDVYRQEVDRVMREVNNYYRLRTFLPIENLTKLVVNLRKYGLRDTARKIRSKARFLVGMHR